MSTTDRASQRAKERAAAKASRAASLGLRLPEKKKRDGWGILRQKLKAGTLLSAIRETTDSNSKRRRSSVARRASLHAIRSHMADIAYQMSTNKTATLSQMDAKLVKEHQKHMVEMQNKKRAERTERRKLIKKQKKLERELEYLNFPTILGWYFDGFFTPYFQLNEEYATIFNEMEVEISKNKENAIKETFAEKAKRYFWPPDILGNFCFRTRGIYLDFNEIVKDPPHTPPEVILDQRVEAVTLFVAEQMEDNDSKVPTDEEGLDPSASGRAAEWAAEQARIQDLMKAIDDNPNLTPEEKAAKKKALLFALKKRRQKSLLQQQVADEMHFKAIGKNDFYFDDQKPGFFKKNARDREKYYYDSKWDVWRIKRTIIYFPNDFYWDEELALFFPKDRTRPPDYYLFDPNLSAYRVAGEPLPPNWRGINPTHFFFDHKVGKWIKKSKAPAGVTPDFDKNGQRFCANKRYDTPDDFYFDVTKQQFEKKQPEVKYIYDSTLGAWKQARSPIPEKGALKPTSFYWNEDRHKFTKKDAPSSFFAWDGNNRFFRKKKSLHGKFHPKNWTWVDKKKTWDFKNFASRHNLISESVYWRPDRDYDKPWLEYFGGYRDYHIEYDYEHLSDEDQAVKIVGSQGKILGKSGGASTSKSGKKLQFSTSEPAFKTSAGGGAGSVTSKTGQGMDAEKDDAASKDSSRIMKGSEATSDKEALAYVDTIDRKTLKATNLGKMINDTDLRKYFASVKKIVRPKVPGTDSDEEYAYLKFKTNEAAAAALKTMHSQYIRGQSIKLSYKLKVEDETVGGQQDTIPQPPPL